MQILRPLFAFLLLHLAVSSLYGNVLIFSYENDASHGILAANSLGLTYTVADMDNFETLLNGSSWDLVVMEAPTAWPGGAAGSLVEYINAGGKALMSSYLISLLHPVLASAFEVESTNILSFPEVVHPWELSHPIFRGPNPGIGSLTSWNDIYGTDGDMLRPLGSAVALAGFSENPTDGFAAIVLGNNGRTLYNGFLWGEVEGEVGVQLVANQMYFLLNGNTAAVPEPSTFVLLGSALLGLGYLRLRRRTVNN
jgi:hypothetical protein